MKRWVSVKGGESFRVDITDVEIVDDLKKKIKQEAGGGARTQECGCPQVEDLRVQGALRAAGRGTALVHGACAHCGGHYFEIVPCSVLVVIACRL